MRDGGIFGPFGLAEETINAVEESRRGALGLGPERAMGFRPAIGRATATRPRGSFAPRPGSGAATAAGRTFQGPGDPAWPDRALGHLGAFPNLSRAVRRTRRRAALRQA